jgi:mRNA interferase MazF
MAQVISVRLDDEALKALRALEAPGMTRSEAIRTALVRASKRLRERRDLAAEVAALEADEVDRAEMREVAAFMSRCAQRGEVLRFKPRARVGHEQRGERFAVVLQADALLPRSVVIVAPTSKSARPASFRPEVQVRKQSTRVLVEQLGAVDVQRLGQRVGVCRRRSSGQWTKHSLPRSDSTDLCAESSCSVFRDGNERAFGVGGGTRS